MRPFIHDDFLLSSPGARELYHGYAKSAPILDYHCHLSVRDIAEDRQFANLSEIWLEGDHYKWRAMRSNGVPERYCTGDAAPFEKFQAWADTVPHTVRNPLYHWTHLELARYFDITEPLDSSSASRIWREANAQLATPDFSARGILASFRVAALCTTDDPADDLRHHAAIAKSRIATRVYPTFRPDAALAVDRPEFFNPWLARLEATSNREIRTLPGMLEALNARSAVFHEHGCRLSDHGLEYAYAVPCSEQEACAIFDKARTGAPVSRDEHARHASYVMQYLGRLYSERDWTMQLHLGALRNNNTRLLQKLGPDTGFDSIGDFPQAASLAAYLDSLDRDDKLPRTILYNLNPADNYVFASMLGNFQDGSIPGKIQLGSGWWFLDQREGMEQQLNALSNLGLLSRFIGMVTDSRSFMSYPRHEYFRRVLCDLVGKDVASGLIPPDSDLAGNLVHEICHSNAANYLRLG